MNSFKIKFTKRVVFKDQEGTILQVYEIGDEIEAWTHTREGYFITGMGGIWDDEAQRI